MSKYKTISHFISADTGFEVALANLMLGSIGCAAEAAML